MSIKEVVSAIFGSNRQSEGTLKLTSISFEHHHGIWPTRKHVTDHELGEDVKTDLEVGHGLHHSDRNHPHNGDDDGDEQRPPLETSVPNVTGHKGECEARDEDA